MSDGVPAEPIRIGHAERQAAVEALKYHHEAGRIDDQEYEQRSVTAQNARSTQELAGLFTDLPQPHAGRPTDVSTPSSPMGETYSTLTPGAPAPDPAVAASTPRKGVLNINEPWATTIVSITPILAVILFFVTETWLWFLVIPIVALLVYGPEGRYGVGPDTVEPKKKKKS